MPETTLLVGTKKGLAILRSRGSRLLWDQPNDLHFHGLAVYSAVLDQRTGYIWIAGNHEVHGPTVAYSTDRGASWEAVNAPTDPDDPVDKLWVIAPGHPSNPDELFAGSAPANLWRSGDGGRSWEIVPSLAHHPTRNDWQPGGGGLCLHSILIHPANPSKMWVGISAGGCFFTADSGQTWEPRNRNTRTDFLPEKFPEWGQCVHSIAMDASNPDVLYQQNHCGIYRSDNGGQSWEDVGEGKLPTRFGFPIAAHAEKSGTVWIIPQASDEQRIPLGGALTCWRSRDGGDTWEALREGLPQRGAFVSVLRHAIARDEHSPAGVYFGTTGGHLFGSRDEGDVWQLICPFLPPILCLDAISEH